MSSIRTSNPRKRKNRIPDYLRNQAEDMLNDGESVHQVWRRTALSKPYIMNLRDKLKEEKAETEFKTHKS